MARAQPAWRKAVPVAILALGVGLSVFAFDQARRVDADRVRSALELRAQWRAHDYQNKLNDALVPVEALAVFVASQDELLPVEFHRFARLARGDDPIARLTWAPWVADSDRAAFVATARRSGNTSYEIEERQPGGGFTLVPAAARDHYAPILFEERFENRLSALGLDLLSQPAMRVYAERARDRGLPIATLPVPSITAPNRDLSWTAIWPVYQGGNVPETEETRRARILGFATGTFRPNAVMAFAIKDTPTIVSTLSIFIAPQEATHGDVAAVVYHDDTGVIGPGSTALGVPVLGGMRFANSFSALGEVWTIVSDFSPATVAAFGSPADWIYLVLGSLISLMLATYVAIEQRRRQNVETLVAERTRDLAATNASLRTEIEGREIAQSELVRAGDQLKAMIEASPAGIVCVDPELRVLIWNKSAERIFGYTADEVVGRPHPLIPDEERAAFVEGFNLALGGAVLRDRPGHRRRKDGTIIETNYSAAPFHDSAGASLGVVYGCEDVSERNRLQSQFLRAQKLETVGQLTGGLAHDFNNILGAVIGNLELLAEKLDGEATSALYCREALDAALSGAELVKRLLAFSRRQPLRPKLIDINDSVAGIRPLIARAIGEQVHIETRLADNLWPASADPGQLESAILNLAVNARDAMPDGGTLTIATANVTIDDAFAAAGGDLEPGDYVALSVGDTGTGIAPDVLAHAFEPFFTTKAPGKGSGLGLSMVFGTMKQLGGTARIYSEVGVGTTVRLYLPRGKKAADSAVKPDAIADTLPTGSERILLVEDNTQIRKVGLGILQSLGYRVTVAESGDAAMRLIEDGETFDLLFTDVVMPGTLNGIALAHAVHARDPEMRILFASGFTSPMTVRTDIDRLGAELLLKPYRRAELARQVRLILDRWTKAGA